MKRIVVLAVALAGLLAGCSREAPSTAGTAAGRHPWTIPGVLRIADLSEPDNLNPLLGGYQVDVDLSMFWAGYLFNYSDRDQLVPELATTVPTLANGGIAKDGLTITYHLRRGVTWQDGAPFSADDVVFTWHAVMNPANNVQTRVGYDDISAIAEPDRYTAVVHLKRPLAPFVNSFFTMGAAPYPVLPKHLLAQYPDLNKAAYNSKPVGTGPFIVQEWHRGETLRMVANPHYWRGAPKLSRIEYRAIPDDNTLLTSVRTHEVDLWYMASAVQYPAAQNIEGVRPILTPFTQYSNLIFNTQRPAMADAAVRRALAYATDRKRLIAVLSYGVNLPGEGDQPSFSWAHDPRLASLPFDPALARATLERAGWHVGPGGVRTKNGVPLRLELATTTGNVVGARAAVLLQAAWKDVGIDLQVKSYAAALMFSTYATGGIVQGGKFDIAIASWANGVDPDDSTNVMCDAIPPNGQNLARYCDAEIDAQERIALTSFDQNVRRQAYWRVQRVLVDRVPRLTMWFARRFDLVNTDLRNYKPAHAVTTFWNSWEWEI